jgi:NAD(P)-dependent dehydrogenase (short-subunit alcohol dehydrogenase family)
MATDPATAAGRLAGRRALVTGASSGIGESAARLLAAEGTRVGLLARRAGELQRVAADLPGAVAVPADISDYAQVLDALDATEAAIGPVDIVVNCAGVIGPTPLDQLTPAIWDQTLAINLSGAFYVGREAGLRMRARSGGHIVNVASDLAFTAGPGYVDYCASKAGLVGLTRGLAVELAPSVLVNAVAPGPVDTPMMEHELSVEADPDAAREATIRRVPLLRVAGPDEVARAILFLVTDAGYTTGSVLPIDGGVTALTRLSGDVA